MDSRIEAIYEDGVFKPLSAVGLPDHLRVVLRIEEGGSAATDAEAVAPQKQAMALRDAELEQVPDKSPDDRLSSADAATQNCLDMVRMSQEPHDMSDDDAADMERVLSNPPAKTTVEAQPLPARHRQN